MFLTLLFKEFSKTLKIKTVRLSLYTYLYHEKKKWYFYIKVEDTKDITRIIIDAYIVL